MVHAASWAAGDCTLHLLKHISYRSGGACMQMHLMPSLSNAVMLHSRTMGLMMRLTLSVRASVRCIFDTIFRNQVCIPGTKLTATSGDSLRQICSCIECALVLLSGYMLLTCQADSVSSATNKTGELLIFVHNSWLHDRLYTSSAAIRMLTRHMSCEANSFCDQFIVNITDLAVSCIVAVKHRTYHSHVQCLSESSLTKML